MSPDVRQLLRRLRVPGFTYREFSSGSDDRPSRDGSVPRTRRAGLLTVALASLDRCTGRTTLAANLCHSFARRGLRAVALDLDPRAQLRLHFAAPTAGGPSDASWPGAVVRPCGRGLGCVPFGQEAGLVVELLSEACDVLVLDTPAIPGRPVQEALAQADELLIVARPDAASLAAIPATEELLARTRRAWRKARAQWVVNGLDTREPSQREALTALHGALGPRLLPPLQHDPVAHAAFARGRLLADVSPDSQLVADLDALSRRLIPPPPRVARQSRARRFRREERP